MKLNIPNRLTLLRILTIPFFMVFMIYPFFGDDGIYISRIVSSLLFVFAALTDMLDGYIARKRDLITDFGKFMDPLADKFLVFGALFSLILSEYMFEPGAIIQPNVMKHIFFWVAVIVIFRELAVTSMRLIVNKSSGVVVSASRLGKIKTISQIVCITVVVLEPVVYPYTKGIASLFTMAVMTLFTLWSGINYIIAYWNHLDTNK